VKAPQLFCFGALPVEGRDDFFGGFPISWFLALSHRSSATQFPSAEGIYVDWSKEQAILLYPAESTLLRAQQLRERLKRNS
jgi:hypothetical protein